MRGVVFDLDGTLVDTIQDLGDSMNRLLTAGGKAGISYDEYRLMVGRGIPHLVRSAFPGEPAESIPRLTEEFLAEYDAHLLDKTCPYQGVPELLADLKRRGILMGVYTNKAESQARRVADPLFGSGFLIFSAEPGTVLH